MRDGERPLRLMLKPIQRALDDSGVTEIVVNRPQEVGVEKEGRWHWLDVPDYTYQRLDAIAISAGYMTGRECDEANPFCGSTLPDGHRIQVCRPPGTLSGVVAMAIRKPAQIARRIDDDDFLKLFANTNVGRLRRTRADEELIRLIENKEWRAFFRAARIARKTICTCGPTGSGKTDLLKRFIQETPEERRVVTVETDAELANLGPRNKVGLFYNEEHPRLSPEAAIKCVLRMYPTEIWFQEVRGGEAFAFLRALAAGHPGGGTSWHAEEGEEWDALRLMIKQNSAGLAIPDNEIMPFLKRYIDIVIWCAKDDSEFAVPRVWFKATDGEEIRHA